MEVPKRPSPAWVVVIGADIAGQNSESTLEGLRRVIMGASSYGVSPDNFEWVGKTGINPMIMKKNGTI